MTFDPRSLEHLRELGRQLPQELPKPSAPDKKELQANCNQHPIEIENDPKILFQELMNASPDGMVPPHLIDRLKEVEEKQRDQTNNHHNNQRRDIASNTAKPPLKRPLRTETQEEILYASFNRFLLGNED